MKKCNTKKSKSSNKKNLNQYIDELGTTLGQCLLTPTKIYVKPVLELIEKIEVKGISHITGGGFYENMPRMLRDGVGIKIDKNSYEVTAIFKLIQSKGNIPERDMYNTFNMGIGMSIIVSKENAEEALNILNNAGEKAYIIGEIVEGKKNIEIDV